VKSGFTIFLLSFFSYGFLQAQQSEKGRLIVSNDTSFVNKAISSAKELMEKDPATSLHLIQQALEVSQKIEYEDGLVRSLLGWASLLNQQSKFDSAVILNQKALRLAKRIKSSQYVSEAWQGLALNFMRKKILDSARHFANEALKLSTQQKDFSGLANTQNIIGNIYLESNDRINALSSFIKSANIYDSLLHDQVKLSHELANIGNIEYLLGDYKKALEYVARSKSVLTKVEDKNLMAYNYQLTGRIYRKQNLPDKAMAEYEMALKQFELLGDKRSACETLIGIGNVKYDQKKYSVALPYYQKALMLARGIPSAGLVAHCFSTIGFVFYSMKDYKKAIAYLDSSRVWAQQAKNPYLRLDAYQVISEIHKELGDYKKALENFEAYTLLNDSLNQEQTRRAADELEAKYQSSEKQAQIKLLQKDRLVKEAEVRRQRSIQIGTVVVLFLVIVLALVVINRNRIISQTKRQIEIERMRNTIARDLHDDIGSALSSISIMSQLANSSGGEAKMYLQRIGEKSTQVMEDMSDIVWSIHPANDKAEMLMSKIKEFAGDTLEPSNISYTIFGEENLNGVILNIDQRKNLFLIFKEALNNAAKYSKATQVDLLVSKRGNEFTFTIRDNGAGFEMEEIKAGNGLTNMKERAKMLQARLSISSTKGEGTTIEVKLPVT
jgi:signal transduction histidine kinase